MKVKTRDWGECRIVENRYGNRIALDLRSMDGEPIARLTVNIPEASLEKGEFFVKAWSENERIAEDCLKSGLFWDTGKRVQTGWVEAQVWRFA